MQTENKKDINMVIYHKQDVVAICKPDYVGFMGVFLKELIFDYPKGTQLDVMFIDFENSFNKEERVAMVVSKSDYDGLGLRLQNFENKTVDKWYKILDTNKNEFFTSS
jgi:hypothetical protein